jgi:hypothetical protein
LLVTAKLVDTLHVDHNGAGTTAVVDHRLTRAARLLTPGELPFGSP